MTVSTLSVVTRTIQDVLVRLLLDSMLDMRKIPTWYDACIGLAVTGVVTCIRTSLPDPTAPLSHPEALKAGGITKCLEG